MPLLEQTFIGQFDQTKPEESNELISTSSSTNLILDKHIRNFHHIPASATVVKNSTIQTSNGSSDDNHSANGSETRYGWKFVNSKKKKNLFKLNSQSNLIFPEQNKTEILISNSQRDSNSETDNPKQPNDVKNKLNEIKSLTKQIEQSTNDQVKQVNQVNKSIIPTVQINSTPSDKLLNPLTLYQMYHQNDLKFRSEQNVHFLSNLDELKLKPTNDRFKERRSFSSSFGRQYVCCNLFNDNVRQIDFVIVYDSALHEYSKKFLNNKSDNLSTSGNSQESLAKNSLNSLDKNDKKKETEQTDQTSEKGKSILLKKLTKDQEIRRMSANNIEINDELDNNQDEEIEYLNTKIIDSINQRPQINTISKKSNQINDLLETESNDQSDDLNEMFVENLTGKLNENDKRIKFGLNSRQRYLAECCKKFEENLIAEGLELEYSDAQFVNTTNQKIGFLKIHCPWALLCRYAELMKLKMPMKQVESSTFPVIFDKNDPYSKGKFTAPYSRDKEYLFDIPADKRLFFSSAQRSQIVEFILKRKSFSSTISDTSFGINKLLHEGAYIAAFPLHEGILDIKRPKKIDFSYEEEQTQNQIYRNGDASLNNFIQENVHSPRVLLFENWASLTCIFRKQPLDEIKDYYGVKVGLYFAFLGFYTTMLVPASIVGICCFLYGLLTMDNDISIKQVCNRTFDHLPMCPLCNVKGCDYFHLSDTCFYVKVSYLFDNPGAVFFTIFMSLWSTVYLEMWKRYSSRITYRWDLSSWDTFEEYPRPEYLARLTKAEKKKLNLITKMYEPYIPFWKRQLPYTIISGSVVFLLILVALASVIGVIIYRVSVRAAIAKVEEKYSSIFTSVSAALINLICILILNQLYSYVSYYLTELEMPRTQTDFENSLTLKMYLLQFVNYYSSIFYIAFFKGRFMSHPGEMIDNSKFTNITQEECGTGGCLLELSIQLAIIMIGKQFIGGVIEMFIPWLQKIIKRWRLKKNDKSTNLTNMPQYESDFLLAQWRPQSLFYEYLEMILQFGFLSIFSACFSLGPIFALINNLLEIRLDAKKMITSMRRPVAQRVKSIGIWYRILDMIGKISVISSALILAFTSEFIPKLYHYSKHGNLNTYLNSSLSHFNASEIVKVGNREKFFKHLPHQPHYCLYQGYRHGPTHNEKYEATQMNWELLAIKLAFVVIFENVIATTTMLIRYLIPDVPRSLRQKMRQSSYLTNELIMQQEINRAKNRQ